MSDFLGAALGLTGTIIDTTYNVARSKKEMEFANDWAYRQREWALQDWQMQNEYNNPAAQRQRMIDAKMNPALMYGSATGGGVSAPVRTTQSAEWKGPNINMGAGIANSLQMYYDVRLKNKQLEMMDAQIELIKTNAEKNKTGSQLNVDRSRLTNVQSDKLDAWMKGLNDYNNTPVTQGDVDAGIYGGTDVKRNYYAEKNYWDVANQYQNYSFKFDENARRDIYTAKNAEQIAERIALMRIQREKSTAEIANIKENLEILKKSGILKQIDIDGVRFLMKNFGGIGGQILQGLLRRSDIMR